MKSISNDTHVTKELLAIMKAKGITVYQLHKLTGLPKQSTYDLFKVPSFDNNIDILLKICTALNVKAEISPAGIFITELPAL